jgi:multimeric flavodoxin WrbA
MRIMTILGSPRRQGNTAKVLAMIVQRILYACSKLATTRDWHTTTLAEGGLVLYDVSSGRRRLA